MYLGLWVRAFFFNRCSNPDCILEQYSNGTNNETDHNMSNNQDYEDSADEPTAGFEEDTGDTDDSPMSVEAHVSLAWTYCMPLLTTSCI